MLTFDRPATRETTIAAVAMHCSHDVAANWAKYEGFIDEAALQGAGYLVFPEVSLQGYLLGSGGLGSAEMAEQIALFPGHGRDDPRADDPEAATARQAARDADPGRVWPSGRWTATSFTTARSWSDRIGRARRLPQAPQPVRVAGLQPWQPPLCLPDRARQGRHVHLLRPGIPGGHAGVRPQGREDRGADHRLADEGRRSRDRLLRLHLRSLQPLQCPRQPDVAGLLQPGQPARHARLRRTTTATAASSRPTGKIVAEMGYAEGLATATVDIHDGLEHARTRDFFGLNLLQDRRPAYYQLHGSQEVYYAPDSVAPFAGDSNTDREELATLAGHGVRGDSREA